ncbi:MAG: ExbD/TolR family protein [Planctomycetota bacterium]
MSKASEMMDEVSAKMDMTPMIDIVFNLVIFFMLITDVQQKDLAAVTLPLAHMALEDKNDDPDDRVILNVDSNGQLLLKGVPVTLDKLGQELDFARRLYVQNQKARGLDGMEKLEGGAEASKLFVLLRADKDAPWQHVQWIMTIMAEQKLYKLQFATKKYVDGFYTDPEEVKRLGGKRQDDVQKGTP